LHQETVPKNYSQTALTASRASEDYLIEKIEPVYYGLRGSKVDFAALQQLTKQYESDVANCSLGRCSCSSQANCGSYSQSSTAELLPH
jgi:hypothetical protein